MIQFILYAMALGSEYKTDPNQTAIEIAASSQPGYNIPEPAPEPIKLPNQVVTDGQRILITSSPTTGDMSKSTY